MTRDPEHIRCREVREQGLFNPEKERTGGKSNKSLWPFEGQLQRQQNCTLQQCNKTKLLVLFEIKDIMSLFDKDIRNYVFEVLGWKKNH